jgi:hypothetical protein
MPWSRRSWATSATTRTEIIANVRWEQIGNGVVVYSMGDFIFDLDRSEQTDEGLIVELTFDGSRLAQIDIHPTIELDRSQPNLLDPTDGQLILERIRTASRGFLRW